MTMGQQSGNPQRSSSTFSKFQCPLFQFGRLYHTAKRQHPGNRAKHCYLSSAPMHMVSGWVSQDSHHMTMRQQSGNPHKIIINLFKVSVPTVSVWALQHLYHTAKRQQRGNRTKHCYLSSAPMHMVSGWVSQDPHHMTMRQQSGNPHRSSSTFSKFQRSLFRFGLHSICITRQRGYHAKYCYLSNASMHMVSGWFSQGTHVTRL